MLFTNNMVFMKESPGQKLLKHIVRETILLDTSSLKTNVFTIYSTYIYLEIKLNSLVFYGKNNNSIFEDINEKLNEQKKRDNECKCRGQKQTFTN